MTCHHVVTHESQGVTYDIEDANIELIDYKHKKLKVAVIAKCKARDIAILEPKFDISDYPYFSKAPNLTKLEEHLQVVGFRNPGHGKKLYRINTQITVAQYPQSGVQFINVKDTICQGNSGGPVINSAKEVVGIAVEGATQENGDNGVVVVADIDAAIKTITYEDLS